MSTIGPDEESPKRKEKDSGRERKAPEMEDELRESTASEDMEFENDEELFSIQELFSQSMRGSVRREFLQYHQARQKKYSDDEEEDASYLLADLGEDL